MRLKKCVDEKCNGFMSSQWKCGICKKFEQQHCYTVIKLTGRIDPKINETLTEAQVQRLIAEQGTTVNITPKK